MILDIIHVFYQALYIITFVKVLKKYTAMEPVGNMLKVAVAISTVMGIALLSYVMSLLGIVGAIVIGVELSILWFFFVRVYWRAGLFW